MVIIIGISGPSTSGKSTISKVLSSELSCKVICTDFYFKVNSELPRIEIKGQMCLNFDSPDSIEWNYLLEEIEKHKEDPYLILEGFILFANPEIEKIVDILISIDFKADDFQIALERRLNRRGSSVPADYLDDPFKNEYNYLAYYFQEIVWKNYANNPHYITPLTWSKPILKLSATDEIEENIGLSLSFINSRRKSKCGI